MIPQSTILLVNCKFRIALEPVKGTVRETTVEIGKLHKHGCSPALENKNDPPENVTTEGSKVRRGCIVSRGTKDMSLS